MYEDLVKRLRAVVDGGREEKCDGCPYEEDYPCCVDCLDKLHKQAADAIEELQKAVNFHKFNSEFWEDKYNSLAAEKWISVTERLPEDGSDILAVQSYCGEVRIVPANYDRGVWYDCVYNRVAEHITHWMPVPKPPTEGSQMVTDSNQVKEDEK